jgi:small conductance mechanosensitive channel
MDYVVFADKAYVIATGALMALVILIVGYLVAGRVEAAVRAFGNNRKMDVALTGFLAQISRYIVLAMAIISALAKVGIETTSIMAVFASAGLAVGLALQGSLANFASGVMLLFFRPFTVGDVISAAGETGGVAEIGMFATTLINPNNHKIIIGNSAITGSNIINYTTLGTRRTTVGFGVAYGADIAQVCEVAKKAAMGCPAIITDPAEPAVAFTDMAASSLNFACHSWSKTGDWLDAQHQVRKAIYDALNEAGIEIPFDQIVVHNA